MTSLEGLPYLAALLLAAVFAASAVGKWRDLPATARAFRALGVPRPWTSARVVPGVEAALAVGLVITPAGAAGVAIALLVAFTTFLGGRLRAGVDAPCNCFGGVGTGRLGGSDLVRNAWLLVAGVLALGGTWPTQPSALAIILGVLWASAAVGSIRLVAQRDARRDRSGRSPRP